jgi:hypothetical protein
MCLATTPIAGVASGLWESAAVVFDTIVPSQRPVVGRKRRYDIDVRQFVVTENNAVLRRTLHGEVEDLRRLDRPRGAGAGPRARRGVLRFSRARGGGLGAQHHPLRREGRPRSVAVPRRDAHPPPR